MEEIIEAAGTAHGYLASPLSDHISETPEGFLLVVDCPIARTGWQSYTVRDLPQERAEDLGIDTSNQGASIDLYRPEDEVFSPEFLASLNGKAITDNHPPEGQFITPANFHQYACGHIQNVRRGTEQMDDGEWPILADLLISKASLIEKVRNKSARQISLGYDYGIRRDGKRVDQTDMVGNHAAVLAKGRAGDLIAIGDSAEVVAEKLDEPPTISPAATTDATLPGPEASPPGPGTGPVAPLPSPPATPVVVVQKKEKPRVKSLLDYVLGRGLAAHAADPDMDPETLAQAAREVSNYGAPKPNVNAKGRAADAEETEEEKKWREREETEASDRAKAGDRRARDRKKAHDDLDDLLDGKKKATDADLDELKGLLTDFFNEEEQEPEHAAVDIDTTELDASLAGGVSSPSDNQSDVEDTEENPGQVETVSGEEELDPDEDEFAEDAMGECAHCGEATDAENCPSCGCKDRKPANDARARDKARAADAINATVATLRMLKPHVARVGDRGLSMTFNSALNSVTRASRPKTTTGGYGRFSQASRARDNAPRNPNPNSRGRAADGADKMAKLQEMYNAANKGGK
jgi:hypothetical protein